MKAMSRDPNASAKARKAEQRAEQGAEGVITIKPISLSSSTAGAKGGSTGFKKGGFKNAFGGGEEVKEEVKELGQKDEEGEKKVQVTGLELVESEGEEGDWADYDPRRPTGCFDGCPGRL